MMLWHSDIKSLRQHRFQLSVQSMLQQLSVATPRKVDVAHTAWSTSTTQQPRGLLCCHDNVEAQQQWKPSKLN
jgi:hypothetical protein